MINKIIYASVKYIAYGLKFLQLLFLANYLGPEGLAVFGFAQLVALYVSFLHFGIPFSIHTFLSISKEDKIKEVQSYISDGFFFLLLSSIFFCVVGGLTILVAPYIFQKFEFYKYGVISILIGVNLILVQYFSNIYQVYAQYTRVALNELIAIILPVVVILLYKNDKGELLENILWVNALSIFISLIIFLTNTPFKISFTLRKSPLKELIKVGIPMLLSNVSFYLITLSVRSRSSYYYNLEEIGFFTFGLNISNSVMLGLNAISWTFYSTILSKTSDNINDAYEYVKKFNRVYNFILIVIIFSGVLCLPLLFYFLPSYKEFSIGIAILLVSQVFLSMSVGYNSMLIAQKRQNQLVVISFVTLILTIILSICSSLLHLSLIFQAVVMLVAMFVYSSQIYYVASKVLRKELSSIFLEILNYKVIISLFLLLVVLLLNYKYYYCIAAGLIFIFITYKDWVYTINSLKNTYKSNS